MAEIYHYTGVFKYGDNLKFCISNCRHYALEPLSVGNTRFVVIPLHFISMRIFNPLSTDYSLKCSVFNFIITNKNHLDFYSHGFFTQRHDMYFLDRPFRF